MQFIMQLDEILQPKHTRLKNETKFQLFCCNLLIFINTLIKFPGKNYPAEFWIVFAVEKMKYLTFPW